MTVFSAPTTTKLPDGYLGVAYEASIAVNNAAVAELTLSAGTTQTNKQSLPAGLSYTSTGRITGTPTVAGVFNLSVKIADGTTTVDNNAFTLKIHELAPPDEGYFSESADPARTLTDDLTRMWPETV
jgi:hypothetical protein